MNDPLVSTTARRSFGERLVGAIKLDASVYEEIEHDPTSMGQAVGVVVLAALATGIGGGAEAGTPSLVGGIFGSLLGWLASTAVIWLIGVRFMKCTSDYPELLRTLGFASAPRLLAILGFIPVLGVLAMLLAGILGLVAYVIAARQALDVSTGRAVVVCLLAYLVAVAIMFVLIMMFGAVVASEPTRVYG